MAQISKDLSGYEAQIGFEILPPGWYKARIENSEIKTGPKGDYIAWTFAIDGKPNKVWDRMSLSNEISMKRLKSLATCCGHKNPNYIADTEELHGLYCVVKLDIEKDETGQYDPKNIIKAFKPVENGSAPAFIPGVAAVEKKEAPAPVQQKAKMPWEK